MAPQSARWRDILDLISKVSVALLVPTLIAIFTWVKTTETRLAVIETRQSAIVNALDNIVRVSDETARTIADLRVSLAEVNHQ